MPVYGYVIIAAGLLIWSIPFFAASRNKEAAGQLDRRARWGILIEAVAYSVVWQARFWERPLPPWRTALSILFFALAAVLSWSARRTLGRQWRIDAGLSVDHELVTSGPYSLVRHPIYTSMLCLLWAMGFILAPWPLLLIATAVFILGTEIRVRAEDRLLASRFGERFQDYRRSAGAYIPFVKR